MKVYFCSVCKGYHTVDYCLVQQKSDELFDLDWHIEFLKQRKVKGVGVDEISKESD